MARKIRNCTSTILLGSLLSALQGCAPSRVERSAGLTFIKRLTPEISWTIGLLGRCLSAGMAYITKPIRSNELFAASESVLAKKPVPARTADDSRK